MTPAHALGGRQWIGIKLFPFTTSFNKTEAAIFPMQAMLP